jgi:cob(I)alamin adenosyltransferase
MHDAIDRARVVVRHVERAVAAGDQVDGAAENTAVLDEAGHEVALVRE